MTTSPRTSSVPVRKPYAIMRIMKFKTLGALDRQYDHNMRIVVSENILPDHPPPVELLGDIKGPYSKLVTSKLAELGIEPSGQKDKIIAVEVIVTASRAWFDGADDAMRQQWIGANLEWARHKFDKGLVSAKLHTDEETPHIHIVALPAVEKAKLKRGRPPKDPALAAQRKAEAAAAPKVWTLSFHDLLGGHRENLSREQDIYYDFVKHLGLARGEIKHEDGEIALGDGLTIEGAKYSAGDDEDGNAKPRRNITPQEYRAEIKRLHAEAVVALAEAVRDRNHARALAIEGEQTRKDAIALCHTIMSDRERLAVATDELASAKASLAFDQRECERLRAEASEATADAARSMAEASELTAQVRRERASVEEARQRADREMAELALITRAADDENGLYLRRTDQTIAMNTLVMSKEEKATFEGRWTKVGMAMARQLATILERARHLLMTLTDREARLKRHEAEVAAKELAARQIQADAAAQQEANNTQHLARVADVHRQLRVIEGREAELANSEHRANAARTEAERLMAAATAARITAEQVQRDQQQWAEIVQRTVSGDLRAAIRDDGYVRMHQNAVGGGRHAPPAHLADALAQRPPAWAALTMTRLKDIDRDRSAIIKREFEAQELSDALTAKLEKLGKLVPEAERTVIAEVQRKVRKLGDDRGPSIG